MRTSRPPATAGLLAAAVALLATATARATPDDAAAPAATAVDPAEHARDYPLLAALARRGTADHRVYLYKGLLEREQHRYADAIASFTAGRAIAPDDRPLRLELAMTYAWDEQFARAVALYEEALARDPDDVPARLGLARVRQWMDQTDQSVALYRDVLARAPGNLEALRGLGTAYRADLAWGHARALYQRVLVLSPGDREAQDGLAAIAAATRTEVTASAGFAGTPTTNLWPTGGVRASFQWSRALTLSGGYRIEAPVAVGESAVQTRWRHVAQAGATLRLGSTVTLSAAYMLASLQQTVRHAVPLEAAVRLGPSVVLLAGARPGLDQLGQPSLLAQLGVQYTWPTNEAWLMAQVFRYDAPGEHSTVAIGTANVRFLPWLSLRTGGGGGYYTQGWLVVGFVQPCVSLSPRFVLTPSYQYTGGFVQQHAADLSITYRF